MVVVTLDGKLDTALRRRVLSSVIEQIADDLREADGVAIEGDARLWQGDSQLMSGSFDQGAAGFGVAFEWDVPLLEGYRHVFLANRSRRAGTDRYDGCDTPEIADQAFPRLNQFSTPYST